MKQLLLLAVCAFFNFQMNAQLCSPNELYRDSTVGVYPPPHNASNPDGGITESACINKNYEFVFTFKAPRTLDYNGFIITIDSIVLDTDPNANTIEGLPVGMTWGCNPGDCVFDPFTDSLSCALIYGVATAANAPGDYPLTINTKIYNTVFPPFLAIPFPNAFLPGFDGDYTLKLEDENSTNCFVVGADEPWKDHFRILNQPNPFSYYTEIKIYADYEERFDFKVMDMMGRELHNESIHLLQGTNYIPFDGSKLENGMYLYALSNSNGTISQRMIVQR